MHDQPIDPEPRPEHVQQLVLHLLQEPGGPPMWSIGEIATELDDQLEALDAVANLRASGLVHRHGQFVFPTRAATRMAALAES
jgi:hypothetical protein